jgi:hypothetical protein
VKSQQALGAGSVGHGIRAPSYEEMRSAVESTVESRDGKNIARPPVSNPEAYPKYPLGDADDRDRIRTAYVIKGNIYVKEFGVAGIPLWQDFGKAPVF